MVSFVVSDGHPGYFRLFVSHFLLRHYGEDGRGDSGFVARYGAEWSSPAMEGPSTSSMEREGEGLDSPVSTLIPLPRFHSLSLLETLAAADDADVAQARSSTTAGRGGWRTRRTWGRRSTLCRAAAYDEEADADGAAMALAECDGRDLPRRRLLCVTRWWG